MTDSSGTGSLFAARDPSVPFCKGGGGTCEICVGSCGVEEYEWKRDHLSADGTYDAEMWGDV